MTGNDSLVTLGLSVFFPINDIDTVGGVFYAPPAEVVHCWWCRPFIRTAHGGGGDSCHLLPQHLHVVACQYKDILEGCSPPCSIAVAVTGALEVGAAGIIGAPIVIPRHEEQPLAACVPLLTDTWHITTLCQRHEFGG